MYASRPVRPSPSSQPSVAPTLEPLLAQQSQAWQRGQRLGVEAFLDQHPELHRNSEQMLDLIYHEVLLRTQRGESPQLDEYLKRFPQLAGQLRAQFEVHRALEQELSVPAVVSIESVTRLVEAIRQNRLLQPSQLETVTRTLAPGCSTARELARELLQRGWLTAFQVNQLLQGSGATLQLGQYVLLERLGAGGMGQVYKARHRSLDRVVALKLIRKEQMAKAQAVRRFHHEVRAAAQLAHPNVVEAYDADVVNGSHFLVMEYVAGIDLGELVKRCGPLPVAQACDYIRQAALGLQHAHERGLVHRDIKPQNLLVTVQGAVVKLLDLGLARLGRVPDPTAASITLTQEGCVMGTVDYLAPEQARDSHAVDIRADLYSLGCTFYYLLTGSVPFPGGTLTSKVLAHSMDEPVPVEQRRPEVPPELAAVVRKLMAKRPEDRYQMPAELAAALTPEPAGVPSLPQTPSADSPAAERPEPARGPTESGWSSWLASAPMPEALAALKQQQTRAHRRWLLLNGAGAAVLLGAVALFLALLGRQTAPPPSSPSESPAPDAALSPLDRLDAARIPAYERMVAGDGDSARMPRGLVAILGDSRLKHWGEVTVVAFQPYGKLLASASMDGTVKLWETDTGDQVRSWTAHRQAVLGMAFSPDGKVLASGGYGDPVKRWDVATGKPLRDLAGEYSGVTAVAFRPDGKVLAAGCKDHKVRLWDLVNEKELFSLTPQQKVAFCLAFSPDGRLLAGGGEDGRVKLWEAATGNELHTLTGHQQQVRSVAFSLDGQRLASGAYDKLIKVWDVSTGKELWSLSGHLGRVTALAFDPNSRDVLVSGAGDHMVKLWDTGTGKQLRALTRHTYVNTLAFRADGRMLATGNAYGSVRLWELAPGEKLPRVSGHQELVSGVAFSPSGARLTTCSFDGTVKRWDTGTGKEVRSQGIQASGLLRMAVSPDGRLLASGSGDSSVKLWDAATGRVVRSLTGHTSGLNDVVFRADGDVLASASSDGTVKLWETATGKEIRSLPGGDPAVILSVGFRGTSRQLASGSRDGTLILWNTETGDRLFTLSDPKHLAINQVRFSPDGELLAAASEDGTVQLWQAETGQGLRSLARHEGTVASVAFRADGKVLASAGRDGTVRLWDTKQGTALATLRIGPPRGGVLQVTFSLDGQYLATANGNGTAYILRLASR